MLGSTYGSGSMDPVGWHSRGVLATSLNCASVGEMEDAVATARQSYPLSDVCPDWDVS